MKTIHWRIKKKLPSGYFVIEFWSNGTEPKLFNTVSLDSEKLAKRIEYFLGHGRFNLVHTKE